MRDTELYQKLLGFTAPWRVTAVAVQEVSGDTPLKRDTGARGVAARRAATLP
ncbi:MAG: hypothetical protein ACYDEV_00120 [Acidiferrobacter sp.]